jgi:hypothetical protein
VIVIAGENEDFRAGGKIVEELLGSGAAERCVEGIAEPDQLAWLVIGDERAELRSDFGVAPIGEQISAGAVGFDVAPVEVGDDEDAERLDKKSAAGIEVETGKDLVAEGWQGGGEERSENGRFRRE